MEVKVDDIEETASKRQKITEDENNILLESEDSPKKSDTNKQELVQNLNLNSQK